MGCIGKVKYVLFGSVYLQTTSFFYGSNITTKLSHMKKLLYLITNIGPGYMVKRGHLYRSKSIGNKCYTRHFLPLDL